MSAHTPGPWEITRGSPPGVIAPGLCDICEMQGAASNPSVMADARLIAAAPNLAFQLLAAANYIDALGGDSKSYRAALAEATGAKP